MKNSYIGYYRKAFVLLNKNLYIVFLHFIFIIGANLNVLVTNFTGKFPQPIILIIVLPFYLLLVSYFFVPIVLFNDLSKNKKVTSEYILKLMRQLFWKTFFPYIAMTVPIVVVYAIAGIFLLQSKDTSWFYFIGLIISLISPLFSYFGIYFILKDLSVGDSIVKSLTFAIKNMKFTYLPLPYILGIWLLSYYKVLPTRNNLLYYFGFTIFSTYIVTLIQGATLFYFKGKTGKGSSGK